MTRFSERYGYAKPSEVLIREDMPLHIQNAICNCLDNLSIVFDQTGRLSTGKEYIALERYLWINFLNKRVKDFDDEKTNVTTAFINCNNHHWYEKLDLLEFILQYLFERDKTYYYYQPVSKFFIEQLNKEFERLNFAYRVVNKLIVEITSKEEIATIENTLEDSTDNIRMHLSKALELYAKRPEGDYSNSIKESISAVEAYCRDKTGESTLGKALNKLEKKGILFPKVLKSAFEKLYEYTNQKDTGIRHALMDQDGTYMPSGDEALFMLVSCSAFVNHLRKKA